MSDWINFDALWKIVVVGLLAGAGLPALFAIGLRLLSLPGGGTAATFQPATTGSMVGTRPPRPRPRCVSRWCSPRSVGESIRS